MADAVDAPSEFDKYIPDLFDRSYMLSRYGDCAVDLQDFLRRGAQQSLSPNPLFDVAYYCSQLSGPPNLSLSPLVHYVRVGAHSGINPSPLFDTNFYLTAYKDVAAAGTNPLAHFLRVGHYEGRLPRDPRQASSFAVASARIFEDLVAPYAAPLLAYAAFVDRNVERLEPYLCQLKLLLASRSVDGLGQLVLSYEHLGHLDFAATAYRLLLEFEPNSSMFRRRLGLVLLCLGQFANAEREIAEACRLGGYDDESEKAHTEALTALRLRGLFDSGFYTKAYPDVAASSIDPLLHFVRTGSAELRLPCSLEDASKFSLAARMLSDPVAAAHCARYMVLYALLNKTPGILDQSLDVFGEYFSEQAITALSHISFELETDGYINEAKVAFELLINLRPECVAVRRRLGLLQLALGQYRAAELQLGLARELDDSDRDISFIHGRVREELRHPEFFQPSSNRLTSLAIFDDAFPSEMSSFRLGEFSEYLRKIPESRVFSSSWNRHAGIDAVPFAATARIFTKKLNLDGDRVLSDCVANVSPSRLLYSVFLNNAFRLGSRADIDPDQPMVFTLYPGGGFELGNSASDRKLRALFRRGGFRGVITTQTITRNYLIENELCDPEKIHHIYGGIVPLAWSASGWSAERADSGGTFKVCFVAQRYSESGSEKGFDVFCDVARLLGRDRRFEFHAVGDWAAIVGALGLQNVFCHGIQRAEFFPTFYSQMDVLLSPNISVYEINGGTGSFDGFPTTAAVEAACCGSALLMTDSLGSNLRPDGRQVFDPNSEIRLICRDPESIAAEMIDLVDNVDRLYSLKKAGQIAMFREFCYERQMGPRLQLLGKLLGILPELEGNFFQPGSGPAMTIS